MDQISSHTCMHADSVPSLHDDRRHGYLYPIPGGLVEGEHSLVKGALTGLNKLAGSKFNDASQLFHRPATAVQDIAILNARRVVKEAGECPRDLSGSSALRDMMKSHPTYGEPSTLAPFAEEKLKILRSQGRPKPLKNLLPPEALPLLKRCRTHIELTRAEFNRKLQQDPNCCPPKAYWDPLLRFNHTMRTRLIVSLWKIGIITFRTSIKSHVGLFFVRKKDPNFIRMVVDCRIANAHHRDPPVTRLGGGANFASFDLSPEMLLEKFGPDNSNIGWGSECDVSDCFYQFEMPELSKWFGIDFPKQLKWWKEQGINISSVYDEDLQRNITVDDTTVLYPAIGVMPMGWTWALFFANETVAAIARLSSPGPGLEIREKLRVPQIWEGKTLTSTYVDNVAVFGANREEVQDRIDQLNASFEQCGIPVVWTYPQPVQEIETVGVVVDFSKRVIRNKPNRLWKIFLAGREICKRDRVRADAVEVWLGHATSAMRLAPCLLSVFCTIYRFVGVKRGKRVHLWPSVRAEIMQATSLIWFARASLGGHYIRDVDMGDSSGFGYAMTSRSVSPSIINEAIGVKERWRFIALPEQFKSAIEFFNHDDDIEVSEEIVKEHASSFVRSGVGLDTEYGQWLQQALEEGSWLKTSPILSQYKAKKSKRADIEIPQLVKPVSSQLLKPNSFRLLWMKRWRNPSETINIKEARVCLSSLKRCGRVRSLAHSKKLTLCDNLSAVLALEKGRSSSVALNRLCKTAASLQLALDIRWHVRHVETKRNQADGPSRGILNRRPPTPDDSNCFEHHLHAHCEKSFPSRESSKNKNERQSSHDLHHQARVNESSQPTLLKLNFLLPPPGLGDYVKFDAGTCRPSGANGLQNHGAVDDHGHVVHRRKGSKSHRAKLLGCWELFCGEGRLTQAFAHHGLKHLDGVDIRNGKHHDLTRKHVQDLVLEIISSGVIGYVHLGTPCTVFSRARRGIVNSHKAQLKERIGCELAFFTVEVIRLCQLKNIAWTLENPLSSRLWEFPGILELHGCDNVHSVTFPMCAYGEDFKKPTKLLTNCFPLTQLRQVCSHKRHAVILKGQVFDKVKGWSNRTTLAGAYPRKLCDLWAQIIREKTA